MFFGVVTVGFQVQVIVVVSGELAGAVRAL